MATESMFNIDQRSGFCKANSTFYSKCNPISLPSNPSLDITTFISSQPHAGKLAFIDAATDRHLTFVDLWRAVEVVASSLSIEFGIRKGHVILLLSPNSLYFPIVCLAVLSLGAVITTTNPLNTSHEIAKQIADSKPVLIFTVPQLLPKIFDSNLPIILLCSNKNGSPTPIDSKLRVIVSIEEMMSREPSQVRFKEQVNLDDTATLLYSSNTIGTSKGVISSHRNLIAMVQTMVNRLNLEGANEKFICTVPMSDMYGLVLFAIGIIASGSTVVLVSKVEMEETLRVIQKFSITYMPLVPSVLVALAKNANFIKKKYDLSSLHSVLCGGEPLSKEVTEGFLEKFPNVKIYQAYGLESTGIGYSTNSVKESRKYGTIGMLSQSMEVKIVDPKSGEALPINQTGELWLRGPTIMKGYFSNEEATSSTLDSEGWLRTGDLCYIDEDGFIFVVDRLKELIKHAVSKM